MPKKNGMQYENSNMWVPKDAKHVLKIDYSGMERPSMCIDGKRKLIVIYSGEG